MDKDRIEGKKDQAKGFIKEKAGKLTNDPDLEAEGKVDRAAGKVKEGLGNLRGKFAAANQRTTGGLALPTIEALKVLEQDPKDTNAILHVTC